MSDSIGNSELRCEGNSTATLESVGNASNSSLLDKLAEKLNAASFETETVDFARMQQLETRLADREQLVSILTDRLEQAADELDRIKRSGGVLSGSSTDGGDAASLLAGHNEVAEKLDRFVNAWEERYEGPVLRQMEAGIEELRERLEQATLHASFPGSDSAISRSALSDENSTRSDEFYESPADSQNQSPVDESEDKLTTGKPLDAPVRLVLISNDAVPDDLDVPIPEPIDEANTAPAELHKGIKDRDEYIRWLCHQMRDITGRLEGWLGKVQSETDDETLHARVDEIEKVIHDQLRIAEIDVSIERAKLSREQATLNAQTAQLAREQEKFARAINPSDSDDDTPMLRRWKKFITNQDS